MFKIETKGAIGRVDYAGITQAAMEGIVSEVASGAHERTATEIHNITYETFKGIEIRKGYSGKETHKAKPGDISMEVASTVPWSIKLEFHGHPFLRPAAWYMKRKISKIIKMILGPAFKGKSIFKRGAK